MFGLAVKGYSHHIGQVKQGSLFLKRKVFQFTFSFLGLEKGGIVSCTNPMTDNAIAQMLIAG